MAPDGTTYIADGGTAVSERSAPSGVIRTFAHNPELCNVASVAVSANGAVFVATPSYVEKVSPNGVLTRVAGAQGSITWDHPGISPSQIVFNPGSLAFDGAGNLDIWSWEPRTIYQLSPRGTIRSLAGFIYATQLARAQDGTVTLRLPRRRLVPGHSERREAVQLLEARRISGLSWPRLAAFQADGVAVAPSGEVFADNSAGNGYGDGNALVGLDGQGACPRGGRAHGRRDFPGRGCARLPHPGLPAGPACQWG